METSEIESTTATALTDDGKKRSSDELSMQPTPLPAIVNMYGLTTSEYRRYRSVLRDMDYLTLEEAKDMYSGSLAAAEWDLLEKAMDTYRGKKR